MSEHEYLIAADGTTYPLKSWGLGIADDADLSNIPAEYKTRRGYGQHGYTVDDFQLDGRSIGFGFDSFTRSRTALWTHRSTIIDLLSPVTGIVTYKRVFGDGTQRCIDGWLSSGLKMAGYDHKSMDVGFSLDCPDPSFYDPIEQSATLALTDAQELSFPFATDTLWFDGSSYMYADISYPGTWYVWPTITIEGPYTEVMIYNTATGASFTLSTAISAADTITIDLTPGAISMTDQAGNNRFDDRSAGGMTNWYLKPGTNSVRATLSGMDSNTSVTLTYTPRYIAL